MRVGVRVLSGARAGATFLFESPGTIRLGRRPENDVQLDVQHDLDVSGMHAEIRSETDGVFLYDMGSANGTFVNGARIAKLRLTSAVVEVALGANGPRLHIEVTQAVQPQSARSPGIAVSPAGPPVDALAAATQPQAGPPGGAAPGPAPAGPASAAQEPVAPVPGGADDAAARLQQGGRVGAKTVAMMIDQALARSRREGSKGRVGRSTIFLRSMVDQAVSGSNRRFKVVIGLLAALLIGSVAGLLVLRYFERKTATSDQVLLRKQIAALMTKLNQADDGLAGDQKVAMKRRLSTLKAQLAKGGSVAPGKAIVQANRDAVFLMAVDLPDGRAKGFCTAFAVRKRLLATNAHCVAALEKFQRSGLVGYVVMNRRGNRRHALVRAVRHPRYRKPVRTITEDVGLLVVKSDLPVQVRLAGSTRLRTLESGDVMYTYGFPGRLARVSSPNATLVQGIIGRVTRLDGNHGSFRSNKLIQHSAFTSGGTSGSPIFDQAGQVIAVNAGSYVEAGTLRVVDPVSGQRRQMRVAKQLSGYNFGIRVDVLHELMRRF